MHLYYISLLCDIMPLSVPMFYFHLSWFVLWPGQNTRQFPFGWLLRTPKGSCFAEPDRTRAAAHLDPKCLD
jgi:hypothetical protein